MADLLLSEVVKTGGGAGLNFFKISISVKMLFNWEAQSMENYFDSYAKTLFWL